VIDDPATLKVLSNRLSDVLGDAVDIGSAEHLTGGASREMWLLSNTAPGPTAGKFVLRRDAGTVRSSGLDTEALVMRAARDAGVSVPAVIDQGGTTAGLGAPYLVLDFVAGETIPRKILRDRASSDELVTELGSTLARIHSVPLMALPDLEVVQDPLEHLLRTYEGTDVPPALQLGLTWLREHELSSTTRALVHGDFRLGNLMVESGHLRAVLDWEGAHVGDPVEDLGWLCAKVWRFGQSDPVAGLGTRETLLGAYERVAGWRPSAEHVAWWELFATVRWGLACGVQAERHLSGAERSVELAAIGRRQCEQEFDVLLALGLTAPVNVDDMLDLERSPTSTLHGRPDLDELLDAVQGYLLDGALAGGGQTRFHARVAANVVRMARRELLLGADQQELHARSLAALGFATEAELSAAIAAGTIKSRWDEVVALVTRSVIEKLRVAHPAHLSIWA
jgi:aminoglycoside phosphotransferase (APT) family kinase protein